MDWHPDRPPMLWHEPWWHTWHVLIPILLILILGGVVIWLVVRMNRMQAVATMPGVAAPPASAVATPASAVATPTSAVAAPTDAALAHARMRYANGEIDRDAFLAIWTDLGGAPPSAEGAAAPAPDEGPGTDGG